MKKIESYNTSNTTFDTMKNNRIKKQKETKTIEGQPWTTKNNDLTMTKVIQKCIGSEFSMKQPKGVKCSCFDIFKSGEKIGTIENDFFSLFPLYQEYQKNNTIDEIRTSSILQAIKNRGKTQNYTISAIEQDINEILKQEFNTYKSIDKQPQMKLSPYVNAAAKKLWVQIIYVENGLIWGNSYIIKDKKTWKEWEIGVPVVPGASQEKSFTDRICKTYDLELETISTEDPETKIKQYFIFVKQQWYDKGRFSVLKTWGNEWLDERISKPLEISKWFLEFIAWNDINKLLPPKYTTWLILPPEILKKHIINDIKSTREKLWNEIDDNTTTIIEWEDEKWYIARKWWKMKLVLNGKIIVSQQGNEKLKIWLENKKTGKEQNEELQKINNILHKLNEIM